MRIRIVGIPSGIAPEEIRQCWVGIELESIGKEEVKDKDVLIGRICTGGYLVFGEVAFGALKAHNKDAYDWWVENHPEILLRTLVFRAEVCVVIP